MKNKNLIIAIVVLLLVLLLGAGGFMLLNKNASNSSDKTAEKPTATTAQNAAQSLMDLMAQGKNLRCTFNVAATNGGDTNGTVYVSKGNVRGDFTVKDKEGKEVQTSMIRIGDINYIWGSSFPDNGGIKMAISLKDVSSNTQASQYMADPNQKVNYNCVPWTVDSSLFTPPANVKFTDMTSFVMPKTSVTGTQVSPSNKGNLCDGIQDPTAKAACENSLKPSGQ